MKKSNKLTPIQFKELKLWLKEHPCANADLKLWFSDYARFYCHRAKAYLVNKSRLSRNRANMLNAVRDADIWHVECTEQIGRTLVKSIGLAYRARLMGRRDV